MKKLAMLALLVFLLPFLVRPATAQIQLAPEAQVDIYELDPGLDLPSGDPVPLGEAIGHGRRPGLSVGVYAEEWSLPAKMPKVAMWRESAEAETTALPVRFSVEDHTGDEGCATYAAPPPPEKATVREAWEKRGQEKAVLVGYVYEQTAEQHWYLSDEFVHVGGDVLLILREVNTGTPFDRNHFSRYIHVRVTEEP